MICKQGPVLFPSFSRLCWSLFSTYSWIKIHMQNPHSNLVALNCTYEYLPPIQMFNYAVLVQTNEAEIKEVQLLLKFSWFKPENAVNGDSMVIQNCSLLFSRLDVFGLCRWLWVSNLSGNMKQGSNEISNCRDNWEILCSHRVWGEETYLKSHSLWFTLLNCFCHCRW
jgi:hypothetical protein